MIKNIIFKKDKYNYYVVTKLSGDDILDIVYIIFYDGSGRVDSLKKSLFETEYKILCGNRYIIYKKEGDTLMIGDLFDEDEKFYIQFSKKTLIKLIDQWTELEDKHISIIVFYRDGDEYNMVDGSNFHEA